MKILTAFAALALALAGLLSACAPKSSALTPPDIAYGQDLCEACGMLIDQPQLAVVIIDTAGRAHKFDEIGDMVQYHAEHHTEQVRAWFVHDYESEVWIRAETAFFVYGPSLATPMGHGLTAFETEAGALAFAAERAATVLSFDEARAAMQAMEHVDH